MSEKPNTIYFQSKGFPEFRFMSNFHLASFKVGEHTYPSVEHYYQAMKGIKGENFRYILEASTPAEAMRRGRRCSDWNPVAWEEQKLSYMGVGVRAKFEQNKDLAEMLLATEGFELVEYAPWGDTFWGVGKDHEGQNNLGKILMQVRTELKGKT